MSTQGRHRASRLASSSVRVRVAAAVAASLVVVVVVIFAGVAIATAEDEYTLGESIASDEFDRALQGSWGAAATGGEYELSVPAHFSTDGVSGIASPPRSGSAVTAMLSGVSASDVQVSATLSVAAIAEAGNGTYAGLELRANGSSHYLGSARIGPGGAVFLSILRSTAKGAQVALVRDVPALTGIAADSRFTLEVRATGTDPVRLSARAWAEGTEAPDWQAVVDDEAAERLQSAGSIGVWTYASSGSQPQPVSYARLAANLLEPPLETPGAQPSPEPTVAPPPGELEEDVRGTPGALSVGTADYAVPEDAIFVDPAGADTNTGSIERPFATLGAAITRAPSGSTIVLRAGEYHGSFVIPTGRRLTIQPYPGEAVWLDGSRVVDNWEPDGDAWVASNWTVQFDASPTYSRGAPDGTTAGWQFVSPDHPMAAHPDQVWIDDVAQRQVGSRELLVPGAFYVDYAAARLYLGSDPTGQVVRASDTVRALVIAGAGSTVRGIGIHRYSPSVPDIGAVAVSAANVTLENLEITDSATTGLAIFASNTRLVDLTISRSGMLGAQASTADRLSATGLLISDNNTEHFNRAPVAGGFKIHKSRGVSVTESAFVRNAGNSLWFDESVYDMTVIGNDIIDGSGNGIVVELSATAVIADNVVLRNERDGILVSDSGHVDIWNNTVVGNFRSVNITQGTRRASDLSLPGHDPRQKLPDPTVTWITEDVTVSNNVFADGTGKCVLCVEDYSHERSADRMRVRSNGNLFHRTSEAQPRWAVVWSRGPGNPAVYTSISAFSTATKQDVDSIAVDGTPVVDGAVLTPSAESLVGSVARPLDSRLAALVGQPERTRHLGAWH